MLQTGLIGLDESLGVLHINFQRLNCACLTSRLVVPRVLVIMNGTEVDDVDPHLQVTWSGKIDLGQELSLKVSKKEGMAHLSEEIREGFRIVSSYQ